MPVVWPVAAPDKPQREGYQPQYDDVVLRSEMDSGPEKSRPLSSFAVDKFRMVFFCKTTVEASAIETFYNTTTARGTTTFQMDDPISGTTYNWEIVKPPLPIQYLGGECVLYEVVMNRLTAV